MRGAKTAVSPVLSLSQLCGVQPVAACFELDKVLGGDSVSDVDWISGASAAKPRRHLSNRTRIWVATPCPTAAVRRCLARFGSPVSGSQEPTATPACHSGTSGSLHVQLRGLHAACSGESPHVIVVRAKVESDLALTQDASGVLSRPPDVPGFRLGGLYQL